MTCYDATVAPQNLGLMEGTLPPMDMRRWVAARSKPKYAALMMTLFIRTTLARLFRPVARR